jgi:hypothetical protein
MVSLVWAVNVALHKQFRGHSVKHGTKFFTYPNNVPDSVKTFTDYKLIQP